MHRRLIHVYTTSTLSGGVGAYGFIARDVYALGFALVLAVLSLTELLAAVHLGRVTLPWAYDAKQPRREASPVSEERKEAWPWTPRP